MSKVLIMEDDLVDQMALMRMLKKSFPQSEFNLCKNVECTISALKSKSFCWIISDFNLPDGTVLDILPFINTAKLICVSGELEKEEINRLQENGLHKFLIKDQNLNYLKSIKSEIENTDNSTVQKNTTSVCESFADEIPKSLEKHFADDSKIKIEILDIFLNDIHRIQIPLLIDAINEKDQKQTLFLSHKIQSSFRVLGTSSILKTLSLWEIESGNNSVDWQVINKQLKTFQDQVQECLQAAKGFYTHLTRESN